MRLAGGIDDLNFVDKDFGLDEKGRIRLGETVSNGKGGRTISITDIGDLDTMSVVLGHEAYRDGVVGANNKQETRDAVLAHTKMAARMREEDSDFSNSFVGLDLAAYDRALSTGNMGIMDAYADALYDSSGDFWKLTKDGKLVYDGKATVRDAETGEVLISLDELGMSDDDDYIGALEKMFNTSRVKAGEIAYTITAGNGAYIQLGTEGAKFSEDDYLNALKYTLTASGQKMADGMNSVMFYRINTVNQMDYLKRQVIIGGAVSGLDRGEMAAGLRDFKGLHTYKTLDDLFKTNYDFMNDELRDFMNLNEYGMDKYDYKTVSAKGSGWVDNPGKIHHMDPAYTGDPADNSRIKKYTLNDGREVVFGLNTNSEWEVVTSDKYRGTYNYGHMFGALPGTIHDTFDVIPYNKKYPK
jgi:hypothetical protein